MENKQSKIFNYAFGVWGTVEAILLVFGYLLNEHMIQLNVLQGCALLVSAITAIIVLIPIVAMTSPKGLSKDH